MTFEFERILSAHEAPPIIERNTDVVSPLEQRVLKYLTHWSIYQTRQVSYTSYPEFKKRDPVFPKEQLVSIGKGLTAAIINSGIYDTPLTFSDFSSLRQSFYLSFSRLTSVIDIVKVATIANAIGFLAPSEVNKDPELYSYYSKPNMTVEKIKLKNQYQAISFVDFLTNSGYLSVIYSGFFDLDNKAHKNNASCAKNIFGRASNIIVEVASDDESGILKGKSPIRDVNNRLDNMLGVTGVDTGFPIIIPKQINTRAKLISFYNRLHFMLKPHIRICGHPKSVGVDSLNLFLQQCRKANILLLTNNEYIEVHTTGERSLIEN